MVPGKEEGEEVVGDNLFIHLIHIYVVLLLEDLGSTVKWSMFLCRVCNLNFKAVEIFV